ncbi:MAG: MerC domain-containing protein [Candidatus Sericytochromatia bacterium]
MNYDKNVSQKYNLDSIGFSASFLCAIHCIFVPIFLTTLSASSLSFLSNPRIEFFMIIFSIFIALLSLIPSYKNHKSLLPIISVFMGFFLIFTGHFLVNENYEYIFTPIGAFIIAFSHIINWQKNKYFIQCSCNND